MRANTGAKLCSQVRFVVFAWPLCQDEKTSGWNVVQTFPERQRILSLTRIIFFNFHRRGVDIS